MSRWHETAHADTARGYITLILSIWHIDLSNVSSWRQVVRAHSALAPHDSASAIWRLALVLGLAEEYLRFVLSLVASRLVNSDAFPFIRATTHDPTKVVKPAVVHRRRRGFSNLVRWQNC